MIEGIHTRLISKMKCKKKPISNFDKVKIREFEHKCYQTIIELVYFILLITQYINLILRILI